MSSALALSSSSRVMIAFSVLNRKCGCSCDFNASNRDCASSVASLLASTSRRTFSCWKCSACWIANRAQ
ncbi:hypothetical protein D3C86_2053000 [compost metagenome]